MLRLLPRPSPFFLFRLIRPGKALEIAFAYLPASSQPLAMFFPRLTTAKLTAPLQVTSPLSSARNLQLSCQFSARQQILYSPLNLKVFYTPSPRLSSLVFQWPSISVYQCLPEHSSLPVAFLREIGHCTQISGRIRWN